MAKTCSDVRHDFVEAYHALMEIDRQIIVYINQIDLQNQLYKKIRKLKYKNRHKHCAGAGRHEPAMDGR